MPKYVPLNDDLYAYVLRTWGREDALLAELRQETAQLPQAAMQIAADQGAFMQMLVRLTGARRCLEVGVFTGYSSLAVALALPDDGRLVACDVSAEYTAVAQRYWRRAGVAHKVDLRLGPALETLAELGPDGDFDFAFIDADKPNYDAYYEQALRLVRPGGLIAVDNVLWNGAVADLARQDANTLALRALNAKLGADQRIDLCLVNVGDGVTLARRR